MNNERHYKTLLKILACLCLLLCVVWLYASREHAKCLVEYGNIQSRQQQEAASNENTPSAPAPPIMKPEQKQEKTLRRIQHRNSSEYNSIQSHSLVLSDNEYTEITLDELAEKDPKAYRFFVNGQKVDYKALQEKCAKKKELLEELNPDLLPPEEFAYLQEKLQFAIMQDEAQLQFKRRPLPEGASYGPDNSIIFESCSEIPSLNIYQIIHDYAMREAGIDNPDIISYAITIEEFKHLPGYIIIKPILED